jgi:hypothetical protein
MCALSAALLGLALASPAEAQWKWRDKSGHTQYSDLPPPPDIPDQDILSRPAPGARRMVPAPRAASAASGPQTAASSLAPKTVDPELEARRKKAEAETAEKNKAAQAQLAAARQENCERARAQQRTVDGGGRLMRTNEKGEREILDDQQRAEESRRVREIIASDCK